MEPSVIAEKLARHRLSFPDQHFDMVIASISAGNTAGEVWEVSQDDTSPLLLLWDKGNNVFYLAGNLRDEAAILGLRVLVADELHPRAIAEGTLDFKVRTLSSSLEERLPDIFTKTALKASQTFFLTYDAARQPPRVPPPTLGVDLLPIDPMLVARDDLAYRDHVRAEIRWMWPSEERFFTHGFGVAAVVGGDIACWCTAEYASPTYWGIGIATMPQYEGRGIATASAARFVQEAIARGLTACWECGRANEASVRVAEKVGFALQSDDRYWIGAFRELA
jgi:GNAT superfamily N-acetyltransferase